MKKIAVMAVLVLAFSAVFVYAEKPKTTLSIVSEGFTIDGSLADWSAITPVVLDSAKMLTHGKTEWAGKEVQSGKVYVAFTQDALYVAAEVKSPKGIANNNVGKDMWNGNAVEVFVGFDNSDPEREMYTESDYQLGFNPGKINKEGKVINKPEVFCFNMEQSVAGSKIKAKKIKGGYILEAMVPASFFPAWNVASGNEISFDISIDDQGSKGAARKLQFTWSGYAESYKNPAGWGTAVLK
ncbi:MAG TPA: sugar-binding protein [Candidatus Goldiibacteriota bacterium]|nr:sugar-binding protein [Candidatus Goldiibacteriota bacterium]HRQ44170.1 sugar-binding protein [Candidatus Goldiibacteriota bacterium]